MAGNHDVQTEVIIVPQGWWMMLQANLEQAIALHNDITSHIEAYQRFGMYRTKDLLEMVDGEVREARKLLETIEVPF